MAFDATLCKNRAHINPGGNAVIHAESLKRWMLASLLGLALATPQFAAAERSFSRIVVFGDSLSDPGNAFALAGGTNTPPDYSPLVASGNDLIPDKPYAKGGHHFTNRQTWIEQYARQQGLAGSVRPAFRGSAGATNFAVGGARATDVTSPFGLTGQVNAFLSSLGDSSAPSDALYVIWIGGDDVRDAFATFFGTLANGGTLEQADAAAGQVITAALTSIGVNIQALLDRGASRFLVVNVPNIGLTPAVQSFASANPDPFRTLILNVANSLAVGFNAGLDTVVAPLGTLAITLRAYNKANEVVGNPAEFGLTNATDACIQPNVPPFECKNPDEYLFWDGIHPTAAGHAIIAQEAARLVP